MGRLNQVLTRGFIWDAHCTMCGCGWMQGGQALTRHQADKRASDALKMHLYYKHQIGQPRTRQDG